MSNDGLALIVVSGFNGYSNTEVAKASIFREHLLNNDLAQKGILYLSSPTQSGIDGQPTVQAVLDAFTWLRSTSDPTTDVMIYISDHTQVIDGITHFRFNDGNLSLEDIDSWISLIDCRNMNIIINGESSGLGGVELSNPDRDIYCSMRSYQNFDPDYFNITRSLRDETADLDLDGVVSFEEAFEREVVLLRDTGQIPNKFI